MTQPQTTTDRQTRKSQAVKDIEAHAAVMMKIPSGEQWIGHIQTVVSAALMDLSRWMTTIEAQQPVTRRRSSKGK